MNTDLYERIRFRGMPVAHPDAIIVSDQARFTLLTDRMVRLEWSPDGLFEDRSTYAFPTRYSDNPPPFEVYHKKKNLIIETMGLKVVYTRGHSTFNSDNLSIEYQLKEHAFIWKPGQPDTGNLRGTRRTLDQCEGDAALEIGLLSRSGWVLFDDSKNVVFDHDGWVAPRPDYQVQDWYFLGYGHDYKTAISDYAHFGGKVPLIPRYILGSWWSRYWAYSEQDLRKLVDEFENNGIPLDVFVIDMDWHTPLGWTGYSWNHNLFPDPPAFLKWLHEKGLKITLNLHPADGVLPHEEVYPNFARALHIDPTSQQPVPFRIADKEYVKHYFEMLHHPMEDEGVDFWWMDWQQGEISEVKGLDPLPWINHLHFNDIKRHGVRPMLYSRWGGLGNHRYYIGFSGDTYVTWESLQFQPYMTATAANVLYGWWSHDIGGHMGGPTEPELYARWVQFGALSPVLRLHSTKDSRAERRPWAYPNEVFLAAKAAFLMRYRLIPYLYTMARVASDTNLTLCKPMYYEFPENEAAYITRYQYYLGDQCIAAPFVFPRNPVNKMASIDLWIPPGIWFAYDTLEIFTGPRWTKMVGTIDRMALLVKEGGIIPQAPFFTQESQSLLKSGTSSALSKDHLELVVFPGEGTFRFYEDDGVTEAYKLDECRWIEFATSQPDEKTWLVTIYPAEGQCKALPAYKRYTLYLKGAMRPVQITLNGEPTLDWHYDTHQKTIIIQVPSFGIDQLMLVKVTADQDVFAVGEVHNQQLITEDVKTLLGSNCPNEPLDMTVIAQLNVPGKFEAITRLGAPFVSVIDYSTPEEATQRLGTLIIAKPADNSKFSAIIDFIVRQNGQVETSTIQLNNTWTDHIINVPSVCKNVEFMQWEAEITLKWRGITWKITHSSKPIFPAITSWHCISYHPDMKNTFFRRLFDRSEMVRNTKLPWKVSSPSLETDVSYRRCHVVPLESLFPDAINPKHPTSVYLTTIITSPTERDVRLEFTTNTKVKIFMNMNILEEEEAIDDTALGRFVTGTHYSQKTHLKTGKNILIIDCPAVVNKNARWFFGCAITTPSGDLIPDLVYS